MPSGVVRYDIKGAAWDVIPTRLRRTLDEKMPEAKRVFLRNAGEAARSALLRRYSQHVRKGDKAPARYTGEFGEGLSLTTAVGAKRSYAYLTARSHNARWVEHGRDRGRVPFYIIEEWAEDKLHITDPEIQHRIHEAIMSDGTHGHALFYNTFESTAGRANRRRSLQAEARKIQEAIKQGILGR